MIDFMRTYMDGDIDMILMQRSVVSLWLVRIIVCHTEIEWCVDLKYIGYMKLSRVNNYRL